MIDILLVNPKEEGAFFERMPPLGLAYIAAKLEDRGFDTRIVDFEVAKHGLQYWLDMHQPRYLGISGTSHTRFDSFRLAKKAKEYSPDIVTIYGGVHATFTGLNTLRRVPDVDYVVCGEGEDITPVLLTKLSAGEEPRSVHGICYRQGENIVQTPPAPRVTPLDSLPRPTYHLLNMKDYSVKMDYLGSKAISLLTSRGCLAKCSFCSASQMFGHAVTTHSASRMLDEAEFLFNSYGYEGLKIFDSTFTTKKEHVYEFCGEIARRKLIFPWECEIRIGSVDRTMLETMRGAGCYYVSFGIESASQRVLDLMRKAITIEQAVELLDLCKSVDLRTKVFFSFGHIGETMCDVNETFEFIDKHGGKISTLACGAGVRIYPGTYLEEYAVANALLPDNFEWSLPYDEPRLDNIMQTRSVPVLIQPQLGYEELERIALSIYSRKFRGWKGFRYGIKKVTDWNKLLKLWRLLRIKVKNLMTKGD